MKDVANCDSLEDASMSLKDELFSYSGVEAGLTPA